VRVEDQVIAGDVIGKLGSSRESLKSNASLSTNSGPVKNMRAAKPD